MSEKVKPGRPSCSPVAVTSASSSSGRGDAGQGRLRTARGAPRLRALERLDQRGAADHGRVERGEAVSAEDDQEPPAQAAGVVDLLDHRVDADAVLVVGALGAAVEGERVALVDDQRDEARLAGEGERLVEGLARSGCSSRRRGRCRAHGSTA